MTIQVEVCIQDAFAAMTVAMNAADTDQTVYLAEEALPGSGGIAAATWEGWFQQWFEQLAPTLSPMQAYELSLRLTSDREIHTLNATYRQMDNPTDVLAFAALETEGPPLEALQALPLYLGDIIVSVETAQRQANAQQHSLTAELAWLATHGLLHLLGWDHPDEARLMQMLTQQQALLHTVGLSVRDS